MSKSSAHSFGIALARASAGALLFALPLLMTMEMWQLGFTMGPMRLAIMVVAIVPILTGLALYSGFEQRLTLKGAVVDAFVAYTVAFVISGIILFALALIGPGMSANEILGKMTLQAIPGAFGAMIASTQLGGEPSERDEETEGPGDERPGAYYWELFLMVCGALFFSFNIAPTDEMVVIAYRVSAWHAIALVGLSLGTMHAFVYVVEFRGQEKIPTARSAWFVFVRFTLVGYALVLLVSGYSLWSFGRTDGNGFEVTLQIAIVLAFPSSVGAAAARLIL